VTVSVTQVSHAELSHADRVPLAPEPRQRAHGCELGRALGEVLLGLLEGDLHLVTLLSLRATELLLLLAGGLVQAGDACVQVAQVGLAQLGKALELDAHVGDEVVEPCGPFGEKVRNGSRAAAAA